MSKKIPIILLAAVSLMFAAGAYWYAVLEPHENQFDADYVGAEVCGDCHNLIYPEWQRSPHANMTRKPSPDSVVGDFTDGQWYLPPEVPGVKEGTPAAARMYEQDGRYFMALRHPQQDVYVPFEIEYVVGYQYRQVYVTREPGGVLRRLPLQWSLHRQEYFPYWNLQEGSLPTLEDLWAQMGSQNSAWNLFCARCHTTHLEILEKDRNHSNAVTQWSDDGIACEACHGPGSKHVAYFEDNVVNRLAEFARSKIKGEPVAYVANAQKLDKGRAMSVCARCHGSDILLGTTDIYRIYEPGNSRQGRTNDLSEYFQQTPLEPGRSVPTVEVWADGEPRGIGMLFRSMIESQCYQQAEVRCFDCHNPHDNKQPAVAGIMHASTASNAYCLDCHQDDQFAESSHTGHEAGTEGSFCYDCHMPRVLTKLATGVVETSRTHRMSSIPDPENSVVFGQGQAPNACNICHQDQSPGWAVAILEEWFPERAEMQSQAATLD